MKLKDLSNNIFSGGTPSTTNEEFWNGEFYWLSSGETKKTYIRETEKTITKLGVEKSSTRLAKIGDVVIASAGQGKTRGQVAYCLTDTYINQSVIAIRTKENLLNSKYLFYNLASRYNELRLLSDSSSSRGSLTVKIFEELDITLPKFGKQVKIAKILSNYDDLVENNNKRIKILEEMAQKIYKEWFVDFKFPNHETATFKQTELGKIPSDWGVNKLSDFGETITGKTPSKNDDSNYGNEVDFIKTPDMHNGIFCLDTVEHLSLKGANTQKNKLLPIGSICVSCIGTVGVVAITTKNSQTNQQINSIIPKNSFYREYLYFVCNNLKPTLENLGANGATMTNVNKNKFDNIQVSKPSDKLLQAFSQLIKPIFEQIKNLSLKNQTLKQTRDLLLPRLISGEIDVENLEIV